MAFEFKIPNQDGELPITRFAFVFITHDLEFAASRTAKKFVIREFDPKPQWMIDTVPEDTGFSEELATRILGSRRPVLFVEGTGTRLDDAIYRCCFPDWTVVGCGSCESVVHAVSTMRKHNALTRIACSGIVDADDYGEDERKKLQDLGISVLTVSEIENIFLLPDVSRAIAQHEGFKQPELDEVLKGLRNAVFSSVTPKEIESATLRYCRRRIDRVLKKLDLSGATTSADMAKAYAEKTGALDIDSVSKTVSARIEEAIRDNDLPKLLAHYDNKGLLREEASRLKNSKRDAFESWLTRVLRNSSVPDLIAAIQKELPKIEAK